MIVFNLNYPVSFSQYTSLRYTKYKDEDCVLLSHWDYPKEFVEKLEAQGVFKKIIFYSFVPKETSEEEGLKQEVIGFFDDLFSQEGINLAHASEIISNNDGFDDFICYCQWNHFHYSLVEIWSKFFMQPFFYLIRFEKDRVRKKFMLTFGLSLGMMVFIAQNAICVQTAPLFWMVGMK